ncbi:hypothetical protein J5N97_009252 [Dioscorea zingiberensis]|uniref:Uncharacterized protein n=1 Tax=Dioscorea zingiberensis TaxID=325984 RepID=A0A9D5CYE4_9LILI|nr:hypothetical protein J5N97_009252 [Dioscorea zingiberensis]
MQTSPEARGYPRQRSPCSDCRQSRSGARPRISWPGRSLNAMGQDSGNPSLPHVCVATIISFLFGYRIGVVNGPLESISLDLRFVGNTLAEDLVLWRGQTWMLSSKEKLVGIQRPPPASKEVVANLPIITVTEEIIAKLGTGTKCAVMMVYNYVEEQREVRKSGLHVLGCRVSWRYANHCDKCFGDVQVDVQGRGHDEGGLRNKALSGHVAKRVPGWDELGDNTVVVQRGASTGHDGGSEGEGKGRKIEEPGRAGKGRDVPDVDVKVRAGDGGDEDILGNESDLSPVQSVLGLDADRTPRLYVGSLEGMYPGAPNWLFNSEQGHVPTVEATRRNYWDKLGPFYRLCCKHVDLAHH